jgi:hypothetical protein
MQKNRTSNCEELLETNREQIKFLKKLILMYPNDGDLGKMVRNYFKDDESIRKITSEQTYRC